MNPAAVRLPASQQRRSAQQSLSISARAATRLCLHDSSLGMHISQTRRKLKAIGYTEREVRRVWGKGCACSCACGPA